MGVRSGSHRSPDQPPIVKWHESLFGVDLLLLHASPVYYGLGVPHGDGSPVLLIPGFLHSDLYLVVLYAWLKRIGYRPYYSGIGLNAECPNLLIKNHLEAIINQVRRDTGHKLHLIGHSLGGVIARSIAIQRPNAIASVITLGSPFPGAVLHRSIMRESEVVRGLIQSRHGAAVWPECYTEHCHCDFMESLRRRVPSRVRHTAIFTRNDGILDWRSCRTGNPKVDLEVAGTHAGLVFNPSVYTAIARRLTKLD